MSNQKKKLFHFIGRRQICYVLNRGLNVIKEIKRLVDFPHLALTIARTYIFNFHSKTTIVVHKHKSQGLWKPKGSRREIDFIALLYSKSGLLNNLIYNYEIVHSYQP